jgi:hypothetical protein
MEKSLKQVTELDLMVIPFMRITGVHFGKTPAWYKKIRPKKGQIKVVSWFDHCGKMKQNKEVLVVEPSGSLTGGLGILLKANVLATYDLGVGSAYCVRANDSNR